MFGMGFGEIVVILIVALLFVGPEKLPAAAKSISSTIRGFRKQTRELQQSLEDDSEMGDAIRDLKSALRGEDVSGPRWNKPRPRIDATTAAAPAANPDPAAPADAPPNGSAEGATGESAAAAAAAAKGMVSSAPTAPAGNVGTDGTAGATAGATADAPGASAPDGTVARQAHPAPAAAQSAQSDSPSPQAPSKS